MRWRGRRNAECGIRNFRRGSTGLCNSSVVSPLKTSALPRGYLWTRNFLPRLPIADFRLQIAPVVEVSAALGSASELVVLVFEQDVERRERSVTAGDVLLQLELVRIAQLVARVYLLLEVLAGYSGS